MLASWQTIEADAEPALSVARNIGEAVQGAIRERGAAFVALCGGRTPRGAFAALAERPLDWPRLTIVPTDDRFVAPTHEHSNEGLLRTTLLRGTTHEARLISLWSTEPTPAAVAAAADKRLQFYSQPFDFVLLGMGEDGHIASLFPGSRGFAAAMSPAHGESVAVVTPGPTAPPPHVVRLSLTLPRLLNARRICLLISGQTKRLLLLQVMHNPDLQRWPVSALFLPGAPPVDVIWMEGEAV